MCGAACGCEVEYGILFSSDSVRPPEPELGIRDLRPVRYPKPDGYPEGFIREFFSDIWAAVKFDAYPMKFGLRAALGVTDELNLMFS